MCLILLATLVMLAAMQMAATSSALTQDGIVGITPAIVEALPEPKVVEIEQALPIPEVTGSCHDELLHYGWNTTVAYNVMMVESGGRPDAFSNDSDDYSVGCFQINLLGNSNMNAKYRDSVANGYLGALDRDQLKQWLSVPKHNVAVAFTMWSSSGWNPWGATTCRIIACY